MAIITTIAGSQSFELVRDRIGEILAAEFLSQYNLTLDEDLNLKVWVERAVPFSYAELPAINVTMPRGELNFQTQLQSNGIYKFAIDCYTKGKTNEDNEGGDADKLSVLKLHKIMGRVRSILEHSIYKTLGFSSPFIMNRHVESILPLGNGKDNTGGEVIGRVMLSVRVTDANGIASPMNALSYNTIVKIESTEKGYFYQALGYGAVMLESSTATSVALTGSQITEILTESSFELIRDRIAEILADELHNQSVLIIDPELDATVWLERFIPFSFAEVPAINVMMIRAEYILQTQLQSNGQYEFAVDFYTSSKANNDNEDGDADKLSVLLLHKLIGMSRYILEHSFYKTLGFASPFIMNRHVESVSVIGSGVDSLGANTIGRVIFAVRVAEGNGTLTPVDAVGYDTIVKLALTDKGYVYVYPLATPIPADAVLYDDGAQVYYDDGVYVQYVL